MNVRAVFKNILTIVFLVKINCLIVNPTNQLENQVGRNFTSEEFKFYMIYEMNAFVKCFKIIFKYVCNKEYCF